MAEATSIINRAGVTDDIAFGQLIAGAPPGVQELTRAVRDLVYDVLPQAVEVI